MPAPDSDLPAQDGGYDAGYRACPCFWGTTPGRLVTALVSTVDVQGSRILDLGCGEGKNAAYLAQLGARLEAWDVSQHALAHAHRLWPTGDVNWRRKSATALASSRMVFDHIVAYGYCIASPRRKSTR